MNRNSRSVVIKKNIIFSFLLKGISILISLQVIPMTVNYINPTRYGIWLTLSSIIAWLSYFDFGFAHGFRNRFTEAKANGEILLAREYVSTTYAILFILFSGIFLLVTTINYFIDWSKILNIDADYHSELQIVFGILAFFFCLNIVASIFTTMLTADQKPALASLIQTSGQVSAFIGIYILTKSTSGSLTALAFTFSGIPCFLLVVVSIIMFRCGKYREISPRLCFIRFCLAKKILGLGGQFFAIMLSMLFIFQFINIIISRIEGPEAVTQYNIAYKYFNVLNMIAIIVLTPFWSAFTDAYVKKDFKWMRKTVKKLECMWLVCIPILVIMVLCSDNLYRYLAGGSVSIPFPLSLSMAFFMLFQTIGNVYMYLINGTGKVRLQLILYLSIAIIAIPIMQMSCRLYGVEGVLLVPAITFGLQAVVGKIQITKIINNTAKGIWFK
ncbi:oligosaccharide flippase family protein [Bacteroides gallinarum]|uniref:lipopolysaccharide biosynthesis protein n=1 Tax=Bacteroides gallinarum TaxID=376806 RepID=UPI0012B634AC